jgi:MFS family permease
VGDWHLRSPKRIAFARVVLAGLGGFIALGAAFAVVPDIVKQDMRETDVVVGWTLTIFAATALATRFFAGVGIDRRGARAIFALGFLLLAVSGGLFLLITPEREWLLFAARALQGVGQACMFTAGLSWAVQLAPENRRGQAMSLFGLSVWAGLTLGPVGAQLLLDHAGTHAAEALMLVAPALALVALIGMRSPVTHGETPSLSVPREAMRPSLGLMAGAVVMATIVGFAVLTFDARSGGGGAYVIGAYGAATFAGRVFIGHLPDKLGAYKTGLLSFVLALGGIAIIAVAPNWQVGLVGGIICGLAWSLLFPALGLMAVDRTPRAQRNSALAIYTAGFDLGTLVAGFTLGYIASAAGYEAVYVFGAAFAIVGLLLVFSMRPGRDAIAPSA